MKKCLAIILALVMAFGCMSVAAFAAGSPDLSMLTTCKKIMFGTQNDTPVEWVIGGDGTTGMSVPTGCIALVSCDVVASDVKFDPNKTSNAYATSNLKTVVEGAVTFTTDEQAAIQERTLAGNKTFGENCDGVAGDSVTAMVWAPTTKDACLLYAEYGYLSEVGSDYWLCSPGFYGTMAAYVNEYGSVGTAGTDVDCEYAVRAGLYLDLSKLTNVTLVKGTTDTYILNAPEEDTFLTSFTLNKDYNDKYIADTKSTKVNETVSFTITPITENAPEFETDTFTITVTDGAGSADVDLPGTDDIDSVGDYWYKIEETEGTTAGVTYNDTTYYLHLIVSYKDGEFGFSSAVVRSSSDVTATDGEYPTTGKIDTVSNTYGEGSLTVTQETTVNGEESSEDTFTAKVTFTPAEGTDDVGTITYGDGQTVTKNTDGKYVVEVELKGGESVTFNNIPDGVTYTVEQSEGNEDKGYQLDDVAFDNEDEDGDTVTDNIASGTIGDSADTVTISNSKTVPVDVGVIVEYTAFIILALGAVTAGAWLVISRRRKTIEAE